MRALAGFVMKGRPQAALTATAMALLTMQAPLFGVLSSAIMGLLSILSSSVIGLVTLRHGAREGLLVGAYASAATAVLALLLQGSAGVVAGFLLVLWLPIWVLGVLLRSSRSLGTTLQSGLGFGLLLVLMLHLQLGDPQQHWSEALQPIGEAFMNSQLIDSDQKDAFVQLLASWMTGIMAAGFYLQLVLALLVARVWQAQLYNPGGFRLEFRELRSSPILALVAALLMALALLQGSEAPGFVRDLGLLLGVFYLLQGLAVVHGVVAAAKMRVGWLIALYVLLFIALPQVGMLLALAGLMDVFADFRSRFGSRGTQGPGES